MSEQASRRSYTMRRAPRRSAGLHDVLCPFYFYPPRFYLVILTSSPSFAAAYSCAHRVCQKGSERTGPAWRRVFAEDSRAGICSRFKASSAYPGFNVNVPTVALPSASVHCLSLGLLVARTLFYKGFPV